MSRSFITAPAAINPSDADNGATEAFPGYHKQGRLTPEDGIDPHLPLDLIDLSTGVKLEREVGDLGLFGAFTPHRSAANRTLGRRRQLYLSYTADAAGGDLRDEHYAYLHERLKERSAEHGKHGVWFQ
jgi:ectoine hydroxylase-related dioxygenase (phytanoyl-CoA dioxygenase family)